MSMSKKDFVALADAIRIERRAGLFQNGEVRVLAEFCKQQNSQFDRDRWFDYIDGRCGPNGGTIKHKTGA